MKRLLVLMLAGVMLFTTPVLAAGDDSYIVQSDEGDDEGDEGDDDGGDGDGGEGSQSVNTSAVKSKPSKSKPKDEAPAHSEAPATAVEASSIPAAVVQAAVAEGKTVGEYLNNAVETAPGLDYAVPVGQGGHVIINGAPSNQVFSVLKPALSNVDSAKTFATTMGGRVLNVVRINASINGFQTARVNFYMKGIRAGQSVKVFQIVNGQWLEVDVAEIRADHVVVDMTSLGTLAFIEVPN